MLNPNCGSALRFMNALFSGDKLDVMRKFIRDLGG
jgi:hypothetical protein